MMNKCGIAITILMVLFMAGCGSDPANSVSEENGPVTYIAEDMHLPHEAIIDEAVYQNTLYYLNMESETENDIAKNVIYRLDLSQEGAEPVALPVSFDDFGELDSIADMKVDEEGRLNLLICRYEGDMMNPRITDVSWMRLDDAGEVADSRPFKEIFAGSGDSYIVGFETDAKGNVYIASDRRVSVINPEGQLIYQTDIDGSVSTLCRDREGRVYVIWYESQGMTIMAEVDSSMKSLGTRHELSFVVVPIGTGPGTDGNIMIASDRGLYEYDVEAKNYTERIQWSSLDLSADFNVNILQLDDGRVLWAKLEFSETEMKSSLFMIRPQKAGEQGQDEKKTLTFGGVSLFIESNVREAIAEFNRSNNEYRIEIIEYGVDDVQAGVEHLNMDVISGDAPDILILPVYLSMKTYAEKGVLENIYSYIDQDETMQREDFQENILQAFAVDGKLYGIPLTFTVSGLSGSKSLLGERKSWNMDEMTAFIDGLDTEGQVFWYASKSNVLDLCMKANGESLIMQSDGASQFNRDFYLKILEFSDRFIDDDQYNIEEDVEDIQRLVREKQIYLRETNVNGFSNYQLDRVILGEEVTYIGFPSEEGGGFLTYSLNTMAINSKCENKEIAWQFISSLLTEEFQSDPESFDLPILKSALDKSAERAMEKTYTTDEDGNQQEIPKGTISMDDFRMDMMAAGETDVQEIQKMIESVDKLRESMDVQILSIIREESQAYFNKAKSAEEVADLVENRIQLYLNESGK